MDTLRDVERWLSRAEKAVLTALVLFMATMSFLQVVLRGVFSSGLLWADTFLRYLVLWVGFLGAGLAAAEGKQFALELAPHLFSGRARSLLRAVTHLFAALVSLVLVRAALLLFFEEYRSARVLLSAGGFQLPAWTLEVIIPAGFGLLTVHYAIKALSALLETRK